MKKLILQLALPALAVTLGHASQLCTQASYQFYIDNYSAGCSVGDKLFSNFLFASGNVTAPSITVTPIDNGVTEGLQFSTGAWLAFNNGTVNTSSSSNFSYTVAAPGPMISGATLSDSGRITSGSGNILVTENVKNGGTDIPGSPISTNQNVATNAIDFITAGGTIQTSLNITTAISVTANNPGQVTLSIVTETFNQVSAVPEPVASVFIGSGCLLLALVSRKRRA